MSVCLVSFMISHDLIRVRQFFLLCWTILLNSIQLSLILGCRVVNHKRHDCIFCQKKSADRAARVKDRGLQCLLRTDSLILTSIHDVTQECLQMLPVNAACDVISSPVAPGDFLSPHTQFN